MRVCMWGTFDKEYPRNQIISQGLEVNGVEVILCHEPVWEHTNDKTKGYRGPIGKIRLIMQLIWAYIKLFFRYFLTPKHDLLIVGFPGHFDMPIARVLGLLFRKPVVFDVFISLYDTAVSDRQLIVPDSYMARILKFLDRLSCRLASLVLVDTEQHIDYFCKEIGVKREKMFCLPVGADNRIYKPQAESESNTGPLTVLQYCKYAPLHGTNYVLEAARILRDSNPDIRFVLIGEGQVRKEMESLAKEWQLNNVEFLEYMSQEELVGYICRSTICLGIFGATEKAARVVPNKVYQCMAVSKPVITGWSLASGTLLKHGQDVYMCNLADGANLAEAIQTLAGDPDFAQRLAKAGYARYLEHYTPNILGVKLSQRMEALVAV
jgi:glycosyltransferase involved in cell wall biosynthesis